MPTLIELLLKVQLLDDRQHDAVMSRARSPSGGHVVQQVAELGYATEGAVARALSVELGLPRVDLTMTPPEPQAIGLLDARFCADRFVLPLALRENGELLWLAMADPTDQDAIAAVKRRTQKRVRPAVAGPSEILRTARQVYSAPQAGSSAPETVDNARLAALEIEAQEEPPPPAPIRSDAPIAKLAQQLGVSLKNLPSRRRGQPPAMDEEVARTIQSRPLRTGPNPAGSEPPPRWSLAELFAMPDGVGQAVEGELGTNDTTTQLEAVRSSLEKGAVVIRALAELCVEKGLITREEMIKRRQV